MNPVRKRVAPLLVACSCLFFWPSRANAQGPVFDESQRSLVGPGCWCDDVAVGDLDGDGDLDVASIGNFSGDFVAYNDGIGSFTRQYLNQAGPRTIKSLVLADYDNDGDLDIGGSGPWYRNEGGGSFVPIAPVVPGVKLAVDLNNDGFLDLVTRQIESPYGHLVYHNDHQGGYALVQVLGDDGGGWPAATTADVDRDGDLDIFVGKKLFLNSGNGSFVDSGQDFTAPESPGYGSYDAAFSDLNNDGEVDLVLVTPAWGCYPYLNSGTGLFTWTGETLPDTYTIALADVDLDGKIDMVTSNGPGGVYLGDGLGSFSGPVQTFTPSQQSPTYEVALAHLDQDCSIDVIVGAAGVPGKNTCGSPYAYRNILNEFDSDADGVCDPLDNCPNYPNPVQEDLDTDGIGDACDNCPSVYNPEQYNLDGDNLGDACDQDLDGDGVLNDQDACPANRPDLPVTCNGRPLRDCNSDCNVDGLDIQCILPELLGQ